MRNKKIGILALQETHLSPKDVDDVHRLFGKRLQVFATIDPASPQSKGVAIVINKDLSNIIGITEREIIPGRALHLTIPWHADKKMTVLAAYAPNDPVENAQFLYNLEEKTRNLNKPDICLGDWNMVEDPIDRLPHHSDHDAPTQAMRELKNRFKLIDGWRRTYPDTKGYTFLQSATGSQSRIDRILVTERVLNNSSDWIIESSGIHTDHQLVSMRFSDPEMPFIGKGRWVMPLYLLKDKKVMSQVYDLGKLAEFRLEVATNNRTETENPQTIFKSFKDDITLAFRERAKILSSKMDADIKDLKKDLEEVLNDPLMGEDERKEESAGIQEKLDATERIRFQKIHDNTAARNCLYGESTATNHWTSQNKEKKPRDTTFSLQVPSSNPPIYEKRSDRMAELAKTYHESLQSEGLADPEEQEEAEKIALENTEKLSQRDKANLSKYLTRGEVARVLKRLPNGKAPGIDGLVHELWKAMNENFERNKDQQNKPVDIAGLLQSVYNDIERYGVHPDTQFAEGWMCLIHKKMISVMLRTIDQ
ncbi:Endonuclease/exonuclease/phosphatase [Mycena leptocephala]|nr:Endonuclease/exonuclease/phosphatase [Mycena leptocephala]